MPDDLAIFARVLISAPLGYAAMIGLLRASGKRALTQMNAFDFVVTISMGTILAQIVLANVPVLVGVFGLGVLIACQHAITFSTSRSARIDQWLKAEPRLLLLDGRVLGRAMQQERITEHELRAASRGAGHAELEAVGAIVLESDGTLSVLERRGDETSVPHVRA